MSKKISSGILLLIFSVVAMDLHASLQTCQICLKEKVAAAKEKIKKIELKDVLKYTVGAAAITAVGLFAILQYKTNKELLSRPSVQKTDVTLDTKINGIQESISNLGTKIKSHGLSNLIQVTENIYNAVTAILDLRQGSVAQEGDQQTETTVTEVEKEKQVNEGLQKIKKGMFSALTDLKDKEKKVKEQKGKKSKSKRKVF